MSKIRFAQSSVDTLTQLAMALDRAENVLAVWYARGYGPGGENEIVDTDLLDGLKASDLQNIMFFFDSLTKYAAGQSAPQADFTQTINKLRNDL